MNDEAKEINIPNDILATLGDLTNGALNYYKEPKTIELKHKLLLDYITNLQYKYENQIHRYKNLKNYATNLQEEIGILKLNSQYLVKENDELEQIIDEAIEYSKNCLDNLTTIDEEEAKPFKCIHNNYLEILNGGDE